MAINLNIPQYVPRRITNPDINLLNNAADLYQQRHDAAIEQRNATMAFIANKNLNPAENAWAQALADDIETQINDAAQSGSYATALSTARKLAGDVASNRGLLGRERYQQEFQQFRETVQASNDYNQDVKDYTLEQNPYAYSDQYDEFGNVVGGNKFEANYNPAKSVDYNRLYAQVLQTVAPDASSGDSLVFVGVDGTQKTSGYNPQTDTAFIKTSTGLKKLDAKKIKAAFEAAINADPEARASLEQDYKVDVWKATRANSPVTENNPVIGKDGIIKSKEDYIQDIFNPRYKSSAYTQYERNTDIGNFNAWQYFNENINRGRSGGTGKSKSDSGSGQEKKQEYINQQKDIGAVREVVPKSRDELVAAYNNADTAYKNLLGTYNIDKALSQDAAFAAAKQVISNAANVSLEAKAQRIGQLEKAYNDMQDAKNAQHMYDRKLTPDEQYLTDFVGNREANGTMTDSSNPYQRDLANISNKTFGDAEFIYVDLRGNDAETTLNELSNFGLTAKDVSMADGSRNRLKISKDAYIRFTKPIDNALRYGKIGGLSQVAWINYLNPRFGWEPDIKNEKGEIINTKEFKSFNSQIEKRMNKIKDKEYEENLVSTYNVDIVNQPIAVIASGMNLSKEELEQDRKERLNLIGSASGSDKRMMMVDPETKKLVDVVNGGDRSMIATAIGSIGYNDMNIAYSQIDGKQYMVLTPKVDIQMTKNKRKFSDSNLEEIVPASGSTTFYIESPITALDKQLETNPQVMANNSILQIRALSEQGATYNMPTSYGFGDTTVNVTPDGLFQFTDGNGRSRLVTENEARDIMANRAKNNITLSSYKNTISAIRGENAGIIPENVNSGALADLATRAYNDAGVSEEAMRNNEVAPQSIQAAYNNFMEYYYFVFGSNSPAPTSFIREVFDIDLNQ